MRVGYLTSQYPAASHTFIRREIEALRAHGLAIRPMSVRQPAPDERRTAEDQSSFAETFYLIPARAGTFLRAHFGALTGSPARYLATLRLALGHRPPGARALLWALFYFLEAVVVAREVERSGLDHLHNHFANPAATVGMLAAHFGRRPWSMTLHGISETDYPSGLLLGRKIERASFVACASWFIRAQAMRVTPPREWHKLGIVRCGLDLSRLPPRQPSSGLDVICVGRLSAEKGQPGLVEALAAVRARGIDARLTLVGSGPEEGAIRAACASAGVAAYVEFAGRLDEQATLERIARSDLLVLPSFLEGLPVVLMEAMALGTAVVASRVAGIPELVEDGREGLLFRPGDWQDLADKIARLLGDADYRGQVADQARAKVAGEFEIGRAVAPLLERFGGR